MRSYNTMSRNNSITVLRPLLSSYEEPPRVLSSIGEIFCSARWSTIVNYKLAGTQRNLQCREFIKKLGYPFCSYREYLMFRYPHYANIMSIRHPVETSATVVYLEFIILEFNALKATWLLESMVIFRLWTFWSIIIITTAWIVDTFAWKTLQCFGNRIDRDIQIDSE